MRCALGRRQITLLKLWSQLRKISLMKGLLKYPSIPMSRVQHVSTQEVMRSAAAFKAVARLQAWRP
jgi:hypothetical protein